MSDGMQCTAGMWSQFVPGVRRAWSSIARQTIAVFALAMTIAVVPVWAQQPDVAADSPPPSLDAVLARRVTISITGLTLASALDSISHVAKVVVQYRIPVLKAYPAPISVRAAKQPLGIVLENVLNGTKLRVVSDGQGNLMVVSSGTAGRDSTATGSVTGRVIDSTTGRGISGATVKIAGSKISALTGDSGRFVLRQVPSGDQLVMVKVFGYRSGERAVTIETNHPTSVRLSLRPLPNVLSGVVTTATGVQSRREIGNDITVLNVDSVMQTAPIRTVTDLLENRVPGLVIQRSSGVPGAPSRIRLRGPGGLTGGTTKSNDPIWIVDGMRVYSRGSTPRDRNLAEGGNPTGNADQNAFPPPSPIDQLDPNSIETIEVFKGPSATSEWGADAANGVIVVTTKRGKSGHTYVNTRLDQGFSQMPGVYAQANPFVWGRNGVNGGNAVLCMPLNPNVQVNAPCTIIDSTVYFQALNVPRLSPFTTGTEQAATATVSGGSGSMTYSLTASTQRMLGYLKMPDLYQDIYRAAYNVRPPGWMRRPDRLSRWSGQANTTIVPTDGLRLTLITTLDNSDQRQSNANTTLAGLSTRYIDTVSAQLVSLYGGRALVPYDQQNKSRGTTTRMDLQGDWSRWNNVLIANATVGAQTGTRLDQVYIPIGLPKFSGETDSLGYFSTGRGNTKNTTASLGITLLPGRMITTAIGVNASTESTDDDGGYADTLQPGVTIPTALKGVTQSGASVTTAGWYIEPRLRLSDRFNLNPGFRFDGGNAASGSGFAGGKLKGGILAFFPKLNMSWIAVDRQDGPGVGGFLSLLRPRVAFGVAGVQPDPGQNLRLYGQTQNPALYQTLPGIVISTLGNSNLHPERSREVEGGFDANLWGQRVQLTATMSQKVRTDAILPVSLPVSLGKYQFFVNAGVIRNTSQEFTLTADLLRTALITWQVHASYSANQNRVVKLTDTLIQSAYDSSNSRLAPGYPLDGRWARPILGFTDYNHDGRIEFSEIGIGDSLAFLGPSEPKYTLPFDFNFLLWRNRVSVNTTFSYEHGVNQFNIGSLGTLTTRLLDSTTSLADQAAILAAACNTPVDANPVPECRGGGTGTLYALFQSVNALRLASVSVNYYVPESWSRRLRIPRASIAVQGSNVALWTNYRGKDPDVNGSFGSELNSDSGQLPQPRRWILSITLGN